MYLRVMPENIGGKGRVATIIDCTKNAFKCLIYKKSVAIDGTIKNQYR
jgi:hypothetical protein